MIDPTRARERLIGTRRWSLGARFRPTIDAHLQDGRIRGGGGERMEPLTGRPRVPVSARQRHPSDTRADVRSSAADAPEAQHLETESRRSRDVQTMVGETAPTRASPSRSISPDEVQQTSKACRWGRDSEHRGNLLNADALTEGSELTAPLPLTRPNVNHDHLNPWPRSVTLPPRRPASRCRLHPDDDAPFSGRRSTTSRMLRRQHWRSQPAPRG